MGSWFEAGGMGDRIDNVMHKCVIAFGMESTAKARL